MRIRLTTKRRTAAVAALLTGVAMAALPAASASASEVPRSEPIKGLKPISVGVTTTVLPHPAGSKLMCGFGARNSYLKVAWVGGDGACNEAFAQLSHPPRAFRLKGACTEVVKYVWPDRNAVKTCAQVKENFNADKPTGTAYLIGGGYGVTELDITREKSRLPRS